MVAARVTLLSLAALSSCMFGAFRGAPRSGRLERRLGLADDTSLSSVTTAVSTSSSTSSSVGSDTATTATQATDSSSTSSSIGTSASSTSILSTSDDAPCLTCSASTTQASSPPSSPSSTSSTILSLSVDSSSTSPSADTSSSSSVSETSSSSSESETTSSVPESDTATASHYDGRASITSGAGGASSAASPPPKKLPPKLPPKASLDASIMSSTSVDFGRAPPAESTSTSVPAAPASTTSRKLPPAVPTHAVEQTSNMESTTVDFGRPPPAQTTSTLAPDMAWPPTDDSYGTSKVPSDVFAGWSSTRGQAEFDWGRVTSSVDDIDDINTWSHVTWSGGWQTVSQTRSVCQPSDLLKPSTVYSVTHTSTITWTGNPKDYTPPYPPITTPAPCTRIDEDQHSGPQRLTLSRCTSTGTSDIYKTCEMTTVYDVSDKPKWTLTDFEPMPTITFITTDKNPAVIFPHIETPDYGIGGTTKFNVKNPPGGAERTAAVPMVPVTGRKRMLRLVSGQLASLSICLCPPLPSGSRYG
ncbi:hypothetical protein MAPG_01744 [Magnaporthiopsis poae ATCC 64411]|uniref:Uncharacterized protein n=1 Tax=Magnaporthiopsis poae (strain ATCC 64411 / 73-15) TaxID=644358 RepID=A0A0C4DPH7_MAGP6|nr:hypothetical protein MAPG_01744 [Magnaporthiopsis poae ATCC 64411]